MIKGCKIPVAWFEKKTEPPCASYLRATALCPWLSENSAFLRAVLRSLEQTAPLSRPLSGIEQAGAFAASWRLIMFQTHLRSVFPCRIRFTF